MADIKTGWERERRTHFDEIAANYDRARWDYPPALFADILAYKGEGGGNNALEIGAGTGKATAPMLGLGYNVTAVELGANMAEFMREKFRGQSGFNVMVSSFEEADLPDDRWDMIYAASSFHWVDAEVGCPKAFRLLKSGGVFALFRNNVMKGYDFHVDVETLYEKYYLSVYPGSAKTEQRSRESLTQPAAIKRGYGFDSMGQYGFTDLTMKFYEGTQSYSADEYIALLETFADHRGLPERNKAALYAGIREVITENGGYFEQDYLYQLYMGRKL